MKRRFRQESAITNSTINGSDSHELEELLTSQLAEKPKSASLLSRRYSYKHTAESVQ